MDRIGLVATLVILGAIYMATTASLLFIPAIREMDKRPELVLKTSAAD